MGERGRERQRNTLSTINGLRNNRLDGEGGRQEASKRSPKIFFLKRL